LPTKSYILPLIVKSEANLKNIKAKILQVFEILYKMETKSEFLGMLSDFGALTYV
jgi:hypothetical protein